MRHGVTQNLSKREGTHMTEETTRRGTQVSFPGSLRLNDKSDLAEAAGRGRTSRRCGAWVGRGCLNLTPCISWTSSMSRPTNAQVNALRDRGPAAFEPTPRTRSEHSEAPRGMDFPVLAQPDQPEMRRLHEVPSDRIRDRGCGKGILQRQRGIPAQEGAKPAFGAKSQAMSAPSRFAR